jgi:hypothetical protein
VLTGNLLFLSGMLPTEGHGARFIGRVGAELDVEMGRKAAHMAALNVLAVARQHLGDGALGLFDFLDTWLRTCDFRGRLSEHRYRSAGCE